MSAEHGDLKFGAKLHRIGLVVDLLRHSAEEAVEAIAPLLHPEMRVVAAPGVAPARQYQTREDFLAYFADARLNKVLVEPDACEIHVTHSGSVLVTGSLRMTSPAGVSEIPAWYVYTFRDGLIASLENHLTSELAYESAGIAAG
jgi:hypothetical protein